jgi:hypothetical protein
MLYMDEIFGFFPPVANPPSKAPLLTLLKQGRAPGLGVVLATQNPVDLDYKGLSNIGTWWLGRLQTERDKARVLDGLEGANAGGFNRGEIDTLLSGLASRVFLMRNVHEDGNVLFQSRWALSYLRGPLSRDELRRLAAAHNTSKVAPADSPPGQPAAAPAVAAGRPAAAAATARTLLPPDVPQYFTGLVSATRPLSPVVYGAADVRFTDARLGVDATRSVSLMATLSGGPVTLDWQNAERVELAPEALQSDAPDGATYATVPAAAARAKNYAVWSKQLGTWLSSNEAIELMKSPSTGEVSKPDESERDFRARLQHSGRESRDAAVEALRKKYGPKQAALDEKLRKAKQIAERESQQVTGARFQTAISVGVTVMGALFGRKAISASTIGRATTVARGVGRTMKESEDTQRAAETVAAIEEQRRQLAADLAADSAALEAASAALTETLDRVSLKPKRGSVSVKLVALVWR